MSGLCTFISEDRKEIDYEIKNALGRQGIVGLVMTPKATYAGSYEDKSLAWQIDELEVDIVENVTVNRGKKDGYVTGQDASMRLFDVLCPLSGEGEGQFNPVSYQEGEDGNLLVNKCILKCLVQKEDPDAYTQVVLSDGTKLKFLWKGTLTKEMVDQAHLSELEWFEMALGNKITDIGQAAFSDLSGMVNIYNFPKVKEIHDNTFLGCSSLQGLELQEGLETIYAQAFVDCSSIQTLLIPASVKKIGYEAFRGMTRLYGLYFAGKTQ